MRQIRRRTPRAPRRASRRRPRTGRRRGSAGSLEQHVHALDALEPSDEQEVRPAVVGVALARSRPTPARTAGRQRIGHENPRARWASIVNRLGARKRSTSGSERSRDARRAPELRRTVEAQRAAQAVRLVARLAVVPEEHVHRADEPVLVRRVHLHGVPVAEHLRAADERDVVEVDRRRTPRGTARRPARARRTPAGR